MAIADQDGCLVSETDEQMQEFMRNERFIHYVGMINPPRPGVSECITLLEHKHYQPKTPRNELFIMRLIDWNDIMWVIISIPIEEKNLMEAVADECGLRIADGIPTMISGGGVERFPISNERIFTLENKSGHLVYRNDPVINEVLLASEIETFDRITKKK